MTIADDNGRIWSTNRPALAHLLFAAMAILFVLEVFSAIDSTLFHFNDYPDQHLKLFFSREEIHNYFGVGGGIVTNVDRDMLELTYLVSYYNYEYNGGK